MLRHGCCPTAAAAHCAMTMTHLFLTKQDRDWLLLLGSGIHGEGGALLLYRSENLSSGKILPAAVPVLQIMCRGMPGVGLMWLESSSCQQPGLSMSDGGQLQGGSTWGRCAWASRRRGRSTTRARRESAPSSCRCQQTPPQVMQPTIRPLHRALALVWRLFSWSDCSSGNTASNSVTSDSTHQNPQQDRLMDVQATSAWRQKERTTSCACRHTRTSTSRPPTPA